MVSRNPIGVQKHPAVSSPSGPLDVSVLICCSSVLFDLALFQAVTFFYKAHIMAGQVRPDGTNVLDFAWLTKQEIKTKMEETDWKAVEDILADF